MRHDLHIYFETPLELTQDTSLGDVLGSFIAKLQNQNMKLHDAIKLLQATGDQLSKAAAEIDGKIQDLKNSDPDISPEGVAAINRIAAVAQALDDVVPDVATPAATDTNAPAPEVTPIPPA